MPEVRPEAHSETHGARPPGTPGTLYCLPTPLGEAGALEDTLPASTLAAAARLDYFVAERARTARAFLKRLPLAVPLQQIEIRELNEHSDPAELDGLLAPLLAGRDAGLLSEAGCPGVADPGADLVALAHRRGIAVMPLVGPSSLLLALMASGLNGQRFGFEGYIPASPPEREARLRELEQRSAATGEAVIWIEAPYRSDALLASTLKVLSPQTRLVVCCQLTQPDQWIRSARVAEWRVSGTVEIGKRPAVFLLQAAARGMPRAAKPDRRERRAAS